MSSDFLFEFGGWAGTVILLIAYGLVSVRRLEGDSVIYQLANVVGALLLMANSFYHGAMPSVVVNVFWTGIGLLAISRIFVMRRGAGSRPAADEPV